MKDTRNERRHVTGGTTLLAKFGSPNGDVLAGRMEPIEDLVWEIDGFFPSTSSKPVTSLATEGQFKALFVTSLELESSRMYFGRSRSSCERVARRRKGEIEAAAAKLSRDRKRNRKRQIEANRRPTPAELHKRKVDQIKADRKRWAEKALHGLVDRGFRLKGGGK